MGAVIHDEDDEPNKGWTSVEEVHLVLFSYLDDESSLLRLVFLWVIIQEITSETITVISKIKLPN